MRRNAGPEVLTPSATPLADLISARLFKTLRSVALRSYSHLSEDKETRLAFCGPRGGRWGLSPGRSVGRKPPFPGSCSGTHSLRAGIRRFTPPEPINCAGGVKRSSNERPLASVRGDRPAEGWTPEQISGWLKSGNEPRLRAIGYETIYAFIYRAAQKAAAWWRYLTRRHKRPRRAKQIRLANQRIGFLRFAACADLQGVWHGGKVSGYGER